MPIFSSLRRDDPDGDAAARFAQTVLTLAVMVMAAASLVLLMVAPATVELIAPGFDEAQQALYLELFRLMLVTPILFAASITLGEVLVAERRFLFYALAPILYNVGHRGRDAAVPRHAGHQGRRGRRRDRAPASTSGSASSASCARPCRSGPASTCGCRRCASSCG